MHHGNKSGVGPQCVGQLIRRDHAKLVDRENCQRPSLIAQMKRRGHDRRMFDRADHQVALLDTQCTRYAQQRKVVGLGGAASQEDLPHVRADEIGHMAPSRGNGLSGAPAERVTAERIAVLTAQPRQHCIQHFRRNWGGGIEVEIDRITHGRTIFLAPGPAVRQPS